MEIEMEIREDHHGEGTVKLSYHASVEGSVPSLNKLIQNDPLILRRVSLTPLSETPLHVSALLGHLEFSKLIIAHNPRLATELDSLRRSPLHLASAEGHKELVQVLSPVFPDACLLRDQEGRIPLHYAAMRGRIDVLKELMRANPQSIALPVLDRSGETSLHLCVKHNHLDCLKFLVNEAGENSNLLISGTASNTSLTILRLAVMLRQIETVTYLISLPPIRENVTKNVVMDALECGPRDFRSLEIQQIMMDACIINNRKKHECQQPEFSKRPQLLPLSESTTNVSKRTIKWLWINLMQCLNYNKSDRWFEDERGMLMVVATMISAMTFQAGNNPPGGVWQENVESAEIGRQVYCSPTNLCYAGTAVLGYVWEPHMKEFTKYNTISFVASLSVTIFLISGFPLTNRVCLCVTITFGGLTYFIGVYLVMPFNVADRVGSKYWPVGTRLWLASLALIGLFHTLRFLTWGMKKMKKSNVRQMRVEEDTL